MSGSNSSGCGRISDRKMEPRRGSNLHKDLRFLIFEGQHTPLALFKFPGRSISSFSKRNIKNIISFVLVPINRYTPEFQREKGYTWQVDSTVDISWDSVSIGGLDEEVSIDLARYEMGHDDVPRTEQLPRSGKQST